MSNQPEMNFPFLAGLIFAALEQFGAAIVEQLDTIKWRNLEGMILQDAPRFFAFGFVAGVGADWILDTNKNHALAMVMALLCVILVVALRLVALKNWLWLRDLFPENRSQLWLVLSSLTWLASFSISLSPYFYYASLIATHIARVYEALILLLLGQLLIIIHWHATLRTYFIGYVTAQVKLLLDFYCRTSPDRLARLSRNPDEHSSVSTAHFTAKLQVVTAEEKASNQCSCLETDMVERFQREAVLLSNNELKSVVRQAIKAHAVQITIERASLQIVVGENLASARDILINHREEELITRLEELKKGLPP